MGGGVTAWRFVEQMERVGVETALDVGVQEGVGRVEGLGRVERAGLEEDGMECRGERRVPPPRGPTKKANGGGGAGRRRWRGRGSGRSGERQHGSSGVNGLTSSD